MLGMAGSLVCSLAVLAALVLSGCAGAPRLSAGLESPVARSALEGGAPERPVPAEAEAEAAAIAASLGETDGSWLARAQRSIERREYWASRNREGLQAPNRKHGLRTYFEADGIRVHGRSAGSPELLGLSLAGLGRSGALAAVPEGEVASEGARVEIRRPGLVEWYENSEQGLEQGFTLAERPGGDGALVLELAVRGAQATVAGDRVVLVTKRGRRLGYGKLVTLDATGREVPGRLEVADASRLRVVVDDASAAYPLVIDPLLTGTADSQLESDSAMARFGWSVAGAGDVNGDGYADVIVGAYSYDPGTSNAGAAFVFLGSPSGVVAAGDPGNADSVLFSNQGGARIGRSVAGAGDVNGMATTTSSSALASTTRAKQTRGRPSYSWEVRRASSQRAVRPMRTRSWSPTRLARSSAGASQEPET